MMVDNPLVGEPLRTLRSFISQPELPPTMRPLDDEMSTNTSGLGTNTFANGHGHTAHARCASSPVSPKIAFVEAVRLFGGVIIGAGALDISRSFGHYPHAVAAAAASDETECECCDIDVDSDREPFVESYSAATAASPAAIPQVAAVPVVRAKAQHKEETSPSRLSNEGGVGASTPVSLEDSGTLLPKRPSSAKIAKKRKFIRPPSTSDSIAEPAAATVRTVTGDATPVAPALGGRAAARAKAEGQGCTSFVSECQLPTDKGQFRLRAYRYDGTDKRHEPVVMVAGDVRGRENVPVRVHDQCQTSEVLGSKRCDCREQLDLSLRYIQENGGGAVIYLQQEGRGIGLANKVAAYALQDDGLDTVDANRRLGFKDDQRSYECVDFILRDMGIKSVHLMTNNPFKIEWLRATGVEVTGRIPVEVASNEFNVGYLEAKAARMSHVINGL